MFNIETFNVASLTASVNRLPVQLGKLGKLGIFKTVPITKSVAAVEEMNGKLSLVQSKKRGTYDNVNSRLTRKVRTFPVPFLPLYDSVLADDSQNIRAFGSETEDESVSDVVNTKMEQMKQSLELTKEYHRIGAIQGNILDADGSTIFNLFTEFGVTENENEFDFDASNDMKTEATGIIRLIARVLGNIPHTGIMALCGDEFYDSFVAHTTVKGAFEKYQDKDQFALTQQLENGFQFAGITWVNYSGSIDGTTFLPVDEARFFPVGAPGLFQEILAPADYNETVNTPGKPYYAKMQEMKYGKGYEMEVQCNPLMLCTVPACLVKGTIAA